MNLYFRFFILILKRLLSRPQISIFDPCHTHFLCVPTDLDVNFHMNNGVYLSLMDLGRMDLMMKSGTFWKLFKQGFYPVVVSETIRFRKSLEVFQSFEMVTHIESFDEKDFFIKQTFLFNKEVCAVGLIQGRFKKRGRSGSIPTLELFQSIQHEPPVLKKTSLSIKQNEIKEMLN